MTMQTTTSRRVRMGQIAPLAVLALALVSACGSSSSSKATSSPAASTSSGDASVLGPAKPATGEPVKIGFATQGVTAANSTISEINAAKAVVAYANAHLGGLGGHPIELSVCEEKGTPAGGADCGNGFVQQGVAAVTAGAPGQLDSWLKPVNAAGIPIATNQGATSLALKTPGVFVFSNGLSTFGAAAAFARENKLKSAVMLVIDVPTASGPAKQLAPVFFKNAGSTVNVVAIAPGTPDMTPQIQAAQNSKPEMWTIVGDPAFTTSAMKALRTLGINAPIMALEQGIGVDKGAAIPGGFEGVTISAQAITGPNDKEFQLFNAVTKEYVQGEFVPSRGYGGYEGMLSFIRAFNATGSTDVSKAGITKALETAPPVPYPLGGGATFQCNKTALPDLGPNICSADSFVAKASKDGTLSDFKVVDAAGIYDLPKS